MVTVPPYFNLKARKTFSVIEELIEKSEKSIMVTGYSVSDYAESLFEKMVDKSRKGVYVNIYTNDFENQNHIKNLKYYTGRYLKIYNYAPERKIDALHAKIIVVDGKFLFISSSNLSYNGIMGNIELGVVIESSKKSMEVIDLFNTLVRKNVFSEIIFK